MPEVGFEPTRIELLRILSPARLPVPPSGLRFHPRATVRIKCYFWDDSVRITLISLLGDVTNTWYGCDYHMYLTVVGIKGGSGKTTVAMNLACIAASQDADILLVDADDQETGAGFTAVCKEGHPGAPRYTCARLSGKAVRTEILELVPKYDQVIVDTGGRDTTSQRAALSVSQFLLVPFIPCSFANWTLAKIAGPVEKMRTVILDFVAYIFLNRSDPRRQGTENAEAASMLGQIEGLSYLDALLGNRKAFGHAASQGLAVTELTGRHKAKKATAEIMTLYTLCFNVIAMSGTVG